jgi:hypothetical protein
VPLEEPESKLPQELTGPIRIFKSEYIRRPLLLLASVILTLSLIEFPAFINVLDYREIFGLNFAWWPINNVKDPELIHIRRPYAHFSGETRGGGATKYHRIPPSDMTFYRWDVKCDRNGFRNPVGLKSADIAMIGDSFIEGLTVADNELVSSRLAHLQGQVVANLGQSAYGPQQELIVLKRYGLPLRPRTVLWMFSEGTDLKDVVYYDRVMYHPPNFWQAFLDRSLTKIVRNRLRTPPKFPGVSCAGVFQASGGKTVTLYFTTRALPFSKQDLDAIDETTRIIADAHNLCAAQGARLIFVFVPEKFRVFHAFCQFPQGSECPNWVVNDMPERFQKAVPSVSSDIGYLDLTPSLVDATKRGAVPYYPDDDHWSPEGHKIAAEAINDYLLSARESEGR